MKIISPENIGLQKEITKILKNLPQLLSYLNRLKVELIKSSNELKISPKVFEKMYKQLSMKSFCTQNIEIEYELVKELMNDYDKVCQQIFLF